MWALQLLSHSDAEVLKYIEGNVPEIIPVKHCVKIIEISIFLARKQKGNTTGSLGEQYWK